MGKRPEGQPGVAWRFAALMGLLALALAPASLPAWASDVNVGVEVLPPPTLPPTTAPSPSTSAAPASSTTAVPPRSTTSPSTTTTTSGGSTTTVAVLPPVTLPTIDVSPTVEPDSDTGLVGNFRSGVRVTRDIVKGVASGKPLAEVAEEILPPDIANVVVPAIRTTSTFTFPIGLAVAVILFLMVQRRIDASDPKLAAARVAHDEEEVRFR